MSKREKYEVGTEEFPLPLVGEHKFGLVGVGYMKEAGTWYLRAYIDKESEIAVDDCEIISRKLSERLDAKDFIADSYILEVSSPGLGRPPERNKGFERSIGKEADIRLYHAMDKQRDFTGILKSYDKVHVTIEQEDSTEKVSTHSDIALIQLAFDF